MLKPCLPTRAAVPPAGPDWFHEIKHDGYRMLAVHDGERTRLISRHGRDWSDRFPAVVAAVEALAVRACIIDGEVIASRKDGLADFELLRYRRRDHAVTLVAFDLLDIDGRDLRREPIEHRKSELSRVLDGCRPGIVPNAVFNELGSVVFKYACALGCEGTVSKRRGSRYVAGRTDCWVKVKNPNAPAMRREFEEDWGRR